MKQQTRLLKDFLKTLGMKTIKVQNAKQTECDMGKNIIYFSMDWYKSKELKEYENAISKIYQQNNYDIKISLATFGFFHELGHIISKVELKNVNRSLVAYSNQVKRLPNNTIENRMRKYRNLRLEKLADKYGYAIYKTFETQAIQLDKKLKEIAK